VGVLTVNAYLLHAAEPVLIDTGVGADGDDFIAALESVIDLARIRWVWLTHDDADHTGSLRRVLELAPLTQLVTHGMAALRMASWWDLPLHRVHAIRPGDELPVGDRTLRALRPPLYDNPMSTGILDTGTGALFSVDSFGAILPEATEDAGDVPDEALTQGMIGWATFDSPWTQLVDRDQFDMVLRDVRRLQPTRILSSHLPAAGGDRIERFLRVLATLPDADPFVPPNREEFNRMLEAMTAPAVV
jgi:hypothetical protein